MPKEIGGSSFDSTRTIDSGVVASSLHDQHPEIIEISEREFNAADQAALQENEHERFMSSSKKIGHALVYSAPDGVKAKQFNPPIISNVEGAQFRPLKNLSIELKQFKSLSTPYMRAQTPNGTPMIGKRHIKCTTKDANTQEQQEYDLWRFSPTASHLWKGDLFVGVGEDDPPLFNNQGTAGERSDRAVEFSEKPIVVKHKTWTVDSLSVVHREQNPTRKPDQKVVMGTSAHEAMNSFLDMYGDELHPQRKDILQKNKDAAKEFRGGGPKTQHRAEWLHLQGFSLTPIDQNPQTKDNLAAAPKWLNSQMLTDGERMAKWIALHDPKTKIAGDCRFEMIQDTDILNKGELSFSFTKDNQTVTLQQPLRPWTRFPNFPKPTDVMQTTLVVEKLLSRQPPDHVENVRVAQGVNLMPKNVVSESNHTKQLTSNMPAETKTDKVVHNTAVTSLQPSYKTLQQRLNIDHLKSSVAHIFCTRFEPNYTKPWMTGNGGSCRGSGVVIEQNGKKYILTNAHVVQNHSDVHVRLGTTDQRYPAKVVIVGYQCDLALLEVDHPEFTANAKPLPLGEMVVDRQEVQILGFPMGGEEMSYSEGPVSRIMVEIYSQTMELNLQVQTQAPINSGNSGGPVICEDKLVGIAFQSLEVGDGIHYFIPMPVINHFLTDAFSGQYKGFPDLAITIQELENQHLRDYYGLTKEQTGIRIIKVDPLSDPAGLLKTDDIILAIDGISISNDGKVNIPGIGKRLDLNYLFRRKYVGESIEIQLLRKNAVTNVLESKTVNLPLLYREGQTKKVGELEFEKDPSFYINSGMAIQPLTQNYLENSDLTDMVDSEGNKIEEIPRKVQGQEIVLINRIFRGADTLGGDIYKEGIIKKINDQEVYTMLEAVKLLHLSQKPYHKIETKHGEVLILKNLSAKEHLSLLKKHHIQNTASDDVRAYIKTLTPAAVDNAEVETRSCVSDSQQSQEAEASDDDNSCVHAFDNEEVAEIRSASEAEEMESGAEADDEEEFLNKSARVIFSGDKGKRLQEAIQRITDKIQSEARNASKSSKKRPLVVDSDDEEEAAVVAPKPKPIMHASRHKHSHNNHEREHSHKHSHEHEHKHKHKRLRMSA